MSKPKTPKAGQTWTRKRARETVYVIAVLNPRGAPRPCVVIESVDLRQSVVRLDIWHRSYEAQ